MTICSVASFGPEADVHAEQQITAHRSQISKECDGGDDNMQDVNGSLRRSRGRGCSIYCSGLGVAESITEKDYFFLTSSVPTSKVVLGLGGWSDKSMKKCYILMTALAALSVPRCEGAEVGSVVMLKTVAIMHACAGNLQWSLPQTI